MKVKKVNIKKHKDENIKASNNKFISKVSALDVKKYLDIILAHARIKKKNILNIMCLAVRNGNEVDLFRLYFYPLIFFLIRLFEIKKLGFFTAFPFLYAFKRSTADSMNSSEIFVIGNEINPKSKRKDIIICSFNKLPKKLTNSIDVLYFNSLDHSSNPILTAKNIKRVVRNHGYIIICFPYDQRSSTLDPTSKIKIKDIIKLFNDDIIYSKRHGSCWQYDEYVIVNKK